MNNSKINKNTQKCLSCGEMRKMAELIENNNSVCKFCVERHTSIYETNKKIGQHNSPVLWCQDCQTQFKLFDAKIKDPFRDYDDFERAERVHEGIPYQITPLNLARWKCNCKDKKPILTVGMNHSNWAKGFIEKHNKEVKEYDALSEEEKDKIDGITK